MISLIASDLSAEGKEEDKSDAEHSLFDSIPSTSSIIIPVRISFLNIIFIDFPDKIVCSLSVIILDALSSDALNSILLYPESLRII